MIDLIVTATSHGKIVLNFKIDVVGDKGSVVSVVVDDLCDGFYRRMCIYAAVGDAEGVHVDGFAC